MCPSYHVPRIQALDPVSRSPCSAHSLFSPRPDYQGLHLESADCLSSRELFPAQLQIPRSCRHTGLFSPPKVHCNSKNKTTATKTHSCPGLSWGLRHLYWQLCLDIGLGPIPTMRQAPGEVSLGPQSSGRFQKASPPGIAMSAHHHFYEEQGVLGSSTP